MSLLENLTEYLRQDNPYPSLNILEAALVCNSVANDKMIPPALLNDLSTLFGRERINRELKQLTSLGILENTNQDFLLNPQVLPDVSTLLNQLKENLQISLGSEKTAGEFLLKLLSYLQENIPEPILDESADNRGFALSWQGKRYRVQLAFSPAWLPAAAEEAAKEQYFIALFGPFAAQNWLAMLRYYSYPEFRNFTAYFDPWHQQKLNISRGGLFTYFDWFFRDMYGLKFFIPDEFPLALHNMGLLRYNDEK